MTGVTEVRMHRGKEKRSDCSICHGSPSHTGPRTTSRRHGMWFLLISSGLRLARRSTDGSLSGHGISFDDWRHACLPPEHVCISETDLEDAGIEPGWRGGRLVRSRPRARMGELEELRTTTSSKKKSACGGLRMRPNQPFFSPFVFF